MSVAPSNSTTAEHLAGALRASNSHANAIYQMLPDPAGLTRLSDGKYLEVNPAFCRLLNLQHDDVIGRTSTELKVWASAEERVRLVEALQREGQVEDFPMVANSAGVVIPGRMFARKVQVDGEECLVFVFHDTRKEQRAHESVLTANAAMAQAGRMARLGACWRTCAARGSSTGLMCATTSMACPRAHRCHATTSKRLLHRNGANPCASNSASASPSIPSGAWT